MPDLLTFEVATTGAAIPESLLAQSRANAAAVGYATGWSQGMHDARTQSSTEVSQSRQRVAEVTARHEGTLRSAVLALHTAAEQIEKSATPVLDELAQTVLTAAVSIAQSLLGIELRDPVVRTTGALARVLDLCCDDSPVSVRLHPDDVAAIDNAGGLASFLPTAPDRVITIESDPMLTAGDALAVSGATTIDARLDAAVLRLQEYLAQ